MEGRKEAGRESKERRKRKRKIEPFPRASHGSDCRGPASVTGFAISAHCRGSPAAFGRQRPGTTGRLGGCRDWVAGTALAVPGRTERSDPRQEVDLASWAWHRRPRLAEPTAQGTFWKGLRTPPGGAHTQPLRLPPAEATTATST